jgi:hypothetical protein
MQAGDERLPRPIQFGLGLCMGAVAIGWALIAFGWLCSMLLIALLGEGEAVYLMALAAVQVAAAAAGLPPLVRLTLAVQRPHAHRPLHEAESRRLTIAFGVTATLHVGLMLASLVTAPA